MSPPDNNTRSPDSKPSDAEVTMAHGASAATGDDHHAAPKEAQVQSTSVAATAENASMSRLPERTSSLGPPPAPIALEADARAPDPDPVPDTVTARPSTPVRGKQVDRRTDDAVDTTPPSSAATLRPPDHGRNLSVELPNYIDPTPSTPMPSQPPSRSPSNARSYESYSHSPTRSDRGGDERRYASEDEQEAGSTSEIQSIMEQFSESGGGGPDADEVMSPRLEIASPMLGSPGSSQHPPRKSSLEPLAPSIASQIREMDHLRLSAGSPSSRKEGGGEGGREVEAGSFTDHGPPVPPKDESHGRAFGSTDDEKALAAAASPASPPKSAHRPPPPEPEAEPALPFDFHRFLEQLRNKKADPVARYLKSFLSEFGKKQWMVHEQVKIISDFLAFIANKMMQCEVWRDVSDAEFDNAREGMEKLVMNRLYAQTFSPAIPAPKPIPGAKPKRKGGDPPLGPGRRGQHQEDVERDDILTQKINIYGWVREEHLDIPQIGDSGRRFLKLAQQELLKIKSYRAPRDKIICVLNCCKVIFGLLKHTKSDSSADSFMPMLIYVVLQANPAHLVSNVQYILRFRNQEKLGGEAGYYLSSLMGAVQFVENMDRTTLTITDDEFEKNVEAAVSAIAEKHQANSPHLAQQPTFDEKAGSQYHYSNQQPSRAPVDDHDNGGGGRSGSGADDSLPIGGLLKTIQKPLSTIGRIFSDEGGGQASSSSTFTQPQQQQQQRQPRQQHRSTRSHGGGNDHDDTAAPQPYPKHTLSVEEAAARQASAEAAEAQRLQRAEHANVVETLSGMFPDLDKDLISDVVHQKQGRVGLAVDACLALSS